MSTEQLLADIEERAASIAGGRDKYPMLCGILKSELSEALSRIRLLEGELARRDLAIDFGDSLEAGHEPAKVKE